MKKSMAANIAFQGNNIPTPNIKNANLLDRLCIVDYKEVDSNKPYSSFWVSDVLTYSEEITELLFSVPLYW